jgi:hypothetical protein
MLDLTTQFNLVSSEKMFDKLAPKISPEQLQFTIKNLIREKAIQRAYMLSTMREVQEMGIYMADLEYRERCLKETIREMAEYNGKLIEILRKIDENLARPNGL